MSRACVKTRAHTARLSVISFACMLSFVSILILSQSSVIGQSRPEVDVTLVLGIDCSYSVDANEFLLQKAGIANALVSPAVLRAIADGPIGRVSITIVQWSSSESQLTVIPWTIVETPDDAARLAQAILATPRQTADGATSISAFLYHGLNLLATGPHRGLRSVIDVASDGTNNNGSGVDAARNMALAAGVTVNGLAIIHEVPWLKHYFRNHVTGGPGNFIILADSYESFADAMRRKLEREIRGLGIS